MTDLTRTIERMTAAMGGVSASDDALRIRGEFTVAFKDPGGRTYHEEIFPNTLMTAGKGYLLDAGLQGTGFLAASGYMGLISTLPSYVAPLAADTMVSHTNWTEAGSTQPPTYSGGRIQTVWASAGGTNTKALSAGLTFTFTSSGSVAGAFIVLGTSAVNTLMSTAGTLFAAGGLTSAQPVISGNTLTLSYSVQLN